ncbi:hypothetical protein BVC80_875g14 [Macleaya cordata]|uniref:Uncharacterized protein n=1 Tax=Macleaya cordata TaxID=56857 RepID=A0A200PZW4_MACCD|nr:hypothetical protein BVC80_875g14 [Macleaya cordata]
MEVLNVPRLMEMGPIQREPLFTISMSCKGRVPGMKSMQTRYRPATVDCKQPSDFPESNIIIKCLQ